MAQRYYNILNKIPIDLRGCVAQDQHGQLPFWRSATIGWDNYSNIIELGVLSAMMKNLDNQLSYEIKWVGNSSCPGPDLTTCIKN